MKRQKVLDSRILHRLGRIADGLYDAMKHSAIGRAFTSYDAESRDAERSLVATKTSKLISRTGLKRLKLFLADRVEQSRVCAAIRTFVGYLMSAYVKRYGVFFLAFGGYGAAVYFLVNYAMQGMDALPVSYLVLYGVMIASAVPMLFSRSRLSAAFARGRLTGFIFFNLLGLRRDALPGFRGRGGRFGSAFLVGTVCGVVTFWVSPFRILFFAFAAVAAYVVLATPETGLVVTIVAIPFAPPSLLGYFVIFIFAAFLLKLFRGKRTLALDLKDYAIILLALQLVLAGAVSINPQRSFTFSVKMAFFVLIYILIVNMARSGKWIRCLKNAVILAYAVVSAVGLVQIFFSDSPYLAEYTGLTAGEVTSVFDSPETFAVFLSMGVFFVLAEFIGNGRPVRKLFMLMLLISGFVCIWKTQFTPALLACAAAGILFFMIYSNKSLFVFIALLVGVPVSGMMLPGNSVPVVVRFFRSISEYVAAHTAQWNAAASMAGDYFWGGAGMGTFVTLFPAYVNENIAYAENSGNIYLQFIIEIGFFGLLLFGIVVLLFAQHNFSLYASRGGGNESLDSVAGFAGVIAALIIGAFCYAWSDERMFLMFWVIMGISTAAGKLRVQNGRKYINT